MIFFSIEEPFLKKTVVDYLTQVDPDLISLNKSNSFCELAIEFKNQRVKIRHHKTFSSLEAPFSSKELYDYLINLVTDISVGIDHIKYYPFKQVLISKENDSRSLKLNFISNSILKHLLLHKSEMGIFKKDLYPLIWPKDKSISMNKLDTHLTNTKNLIKDKFDYNLGFRTTGGKISLIN